MTLTSLQKLLLTTVLALAAFMLAASTASARLLWTANAERPEIQEWANHSCENGDRVTRVANPAAQGSRSYRIEVRDGDDSYGERCELGQANPHRDGFPLFHEGDERWIGWQMYLPESLDTSPGYDDWTVIMQFKQLGSLGTPAVSMDYERDRFILMNSDTNHESSGCNWWWEHPVVKGRWIKFLYHIKFSPNGKVGWVELYGDLDGKGVRELMPRTNMWTMKVDNNGRTVDSHSRIGLYRDPDISDTGHAFFDGYAVGTDRSSVEQAAFESNGTTLPPAQPGDNPSSNPGPPARPSNPQRPRRRHRRVWIKIKRTGMLGAAAAQAAGPWGRILPVYGAVRPKRGRGNSVIIEVKRHGRWVWMTRGWVRRSGRFYLSPSVSSRKRIVKMRARVRGVGHSRVLRTRL